MYAVEENRITLPDGEIVTTYSRIVENGNMIWAEAGTTGYVGDATNSAGRTYFRIENDLGTNLRIRVLANDQMIEEKGADGFEVILSGDTELETIIRALKFIVKVLEDGAEGVNY